MMTTVATDMTIVDLTMGRPEEDHMTFHHLGVTMTPTWIDALLLVEIIMVIAIIIEAAALEGPLQGTKRAIVFLIYYSTVHISFTSLCLFDLYSMDF